MLYLYGIMLNQPIAPRLPPGLDGHSVRLLPCRDLMGAVSPIERREMVASADAVWCHDQVIEALMTTATILPMRFGRVVADDDACLRLLIHHRQSLRLALERIGNCVEFGLRLSGLPVETEESGDADSTPPTGPGQAWLRHRIAVAHHRRQTIEHPLRHHLAPHVTACTIWPSRPGDSLLRASVLVSRDRIDAFLGAVGSLQCQMEPVSIACTGPWPPYSFSDSPQPPPMREESP
jgi:hypothetical protein